MTTFTKNFELPLYEEADKPNLCDQYNEAMMLLDEKIASGDTDLEVVRELIATEAATRESADSQISTKIDNAVNDLTQEIHDVDGTVALNGGMIQQQNTTQRTSNPVYFASEIQSFITTYFGYTTSNRAVLNISFSKQLAANHESPLLTADAIDIPGTTSKGFKITQRAPFAQLNLTRSITVYFALIGFFKDPASNTFNMFSEDLIIGTDGELYITQYSHLTNTYNAYELYLRGTGASVIGYQ